VSRLAAWCVLVVALTGGYSAYEALGWHIDRLLLSEYGRILVAKVVVFGVVLALGAYNRYWLVPQVGTLRTRETLLYNVGVESVILLVGVLALASLLANTPPVDHHAEQAHSTFTPGSGSVSIFSSFRNRPRSVILRPQAEESHVPIDGWRDSSSALRSDSE
jgi:di/tricarboxylate transporter